MARPAELEALWQRVGGPEGLSRGVVLTVGCACVALGALAVWLPLSLFHSLVGLVGGLLVVSGLLKAGQFLLGLRPRQVKSKGWGFITGQVCVDLAMGALLLAYRGQSVAVVVGLFGALFLGEGLLLFLMGVKAPTTRVRAWLWLGTVVEVGIGVAVLLHLVADPIGWAGLFVGLKLLGFGVTLVAIGLKAHVERGAPLLYQPAQLVPEAGELYAVYFGTAFHLGVYLGEGDGSGEIVHFLDDGKVHRWTWEQFLEAREPHHWTYPDLPETPLEDIRAIARGEIGKEYPYNLLRFNCEHFAIYCKSGGRATTSGYAQVPAIFADVAKRPFLGMVAELNTRIVEFLAFHLGGPAGKRLSLTIRRMGHAVTGWLLVRGGARRAVGRPEQTRSPSPTTPG